MRTRNLSICVFWWCVWLCACIHHLLLETHYIHFIPTDCEKNFCVYAIVLCLSSMQWVPCCIICCISFIAGADTEERSEGGRTPLWYACLHGQIELVQLLIAHGESQR